MLTDTDTKYFLRTDRIGFRWWHTEDLPLAMELWGNTEVTRLISKEPWSEEQVQQRLRQEIDNAGQYRIQYWPMFNLEDNVFLGCAGLRPYEGGILEFGFHLKPSCWGRGLATEAGRRVLQHAFDCQLARAIFAGHHPDNRASRNALIKLGFLGTGAQFFERTGLFHPSYLLYRDEPSFHTRLATDTDARALAIVHCHSIRDTFSGILDDYVSARSLDYCEEKWDQRMANKEFTTLVLLRGEQIVGFATATPSPDQDVRGTAGEIDRLYLHPSVWGSGHGSTMMNWCEYTLIEQGFRTIKLWVFEVNERARRFYEKQGYKPDGRSKQDFGARILRYGKYV